MAEEARGSELGPSVDRMLATRWWHPRKVNDSADPKGSAAPLEQFHRSQRIRSLVHLAVAGLALALAGLIIYVVVEHQHDADGITIDCVMGYHQVGDHCARLP